MRIKLTKWNKLQRNSAEAPYWFSQRNDIFTSKKYSRLTFLEKSTYVFLMCEASQQDMGGVLDVDFDSTLTQGVERTLLEGTIKKLLEIMEIEVLTS